MPRFIFFLLYVDATFKYWELFEKAVYEIFNNSFFIQPTFPQTCYFITLIILSLLHLGCSSLSLPCDMSWSSWPNSSLFILSISFTLVDALNLLFLYLFGITSTLTQSWTNVVNSTLEYSTLNQRWILVDQRHDQISTYYQRWFYVVCLLATYMSHVSACG